MNKQQLASKIWESANKMRSKIEANEYKDYILGFIFYKFLSQKEEQYLLTQDWTEEYLPDLTEDDQDIVQSVKNNIGYFISYENLFSTWIKAGSDFQASNVVDALSAFNRNINFAHKKVFEGIFKTLEIGLTKLGENSNARTRAIRDLIYLINDIPMNGRQQDYDVLGYIYEYLISNFAANAGKKAGEFYTPHEVSSLMSEIVASHLKDRKEIKIFDPTSGSGSLLINIGKSVLRYVEDSDHIKYYAQELKENTYNLTRMNLVMQNILPDNIVTRNGDTLEDDWPYFDESDPTNTYDPLYVDAVVSNPPYSQQWHPENKENDPRYSRFGLAPKSKADYAFLLHDLYHLKPDGIMTIVLPHGVLFRGGEEGEIRKNLVELNHIDAIIGLPANIFFGTGIPTIIMVLKQKRENTDILIIDASKGFEKKGKSNSLRACDIKKIADTYVERKTIEGYSRVVSREEIRGNEYNLNIPRYVDSSEEEESFDIWATMFGGIPEIELAKLNDFWQAFPSLKDSLFKAINSEYSQVAVSDLNATLMQNQDVLGFKKAYEEAFAGFREYLEKELIEKIATLNLAQEIYTLSDEVFSRLNSIKLIDKYDAYQLLSKKWEKISEDLEIIQNEGLNALKVVDPKMEFKKKGDKVQEVQTGWKGHILPFDLVQQIHFADDLKLKQDLEDEISNLNSSLDELVDELSEDAKEQPFVEDNAFALKEVRIAIKNKTVDDETLAILKKADKLDKKIKDKNKEIKDLLAKLELKTKDFIENMSDDEAIALLKEKWISPIISNLMELPNLKIEDLTSKIDYLAHKYETTYADIEREIKETENSLISMLNDLTGSEYDMKGLEEFKTLLGGN